MTASPPDGIEASAAGAADVAAQHADEVDADARFPREAMSALREAGLLGFWLPAEWGGREDVTLATVAEVTRVLGRSCAATSMIFAMHQIQVACLRRHGNTEACRAFGRRVATQGALLASATTEIGIGGDVRRSTCAVETDADGTSFTLVKKAPVISYAEAADAILTTARRHPDAPATDQVLVLCERADLQLERTSEWNTLGLRGTCSPGYVLTARSTVDRIFPTPYDEISSTTMLPVAHILWSACWLGIAEAAAGKARRAVRDQAKRSPGVTPPGALRLAELDVELSAFRARTQNAAQRFDENDRCELNLGDMIDANVLKIYASEAVRDIVTRALMIVGIAGYAVDSPQSLGRHLRDAHGAALMVNNDRILGNTANYEVVYRGVQA